jgi:uncharacterized membrane protein (DUF106 family)
MIKSNKTLIMFIIGAVFGILITIFYFEFISSEHNSEYECIVRELQKAKVDFRNSISNRNEYILWVEEFCNEQYRNKK